ncbi:MAG: sigma 54-interacting transcriptional regulator [Pseudomonadota bacterium]|nr:sigma 54-interacting transcriptional regulator [Pseudomonadota bacterium]
MLNDRTTLPEDEGADPDAPRAGLRLTLLWHPDPARIGETLLLPPSTRGVAIGRNSPPFPGGTPGDAHLSRSPLELRLDRGHLGLWPSTPTVSFTVDGAPGSPGQRIGPEALVRGVRIGLARRLLVWVELSDEPALPLDEHGLVGASVAMGALRRAIARLAPLRDPVLLLGETGSGKEMAARALHALGPRARGPLVSVNVAAIPPETAASQLFGHVAGAFTGAVRSHGGYFGGAEGGTLFLDEMGELPDPLQPLLLRALDVAEIQPVGGRARRVDVRLVAATDADLDAAVAARRFRPALLHRLAVHLLRIPPLRERPVDIAVQAARFADRPLSFALMDALVAHPWPGNTRELRACIARLAVSDEATVRSTLTTTLTTVQPAPRAAPGTVEVAPTPDVVLATLAANAYAVDLTASVLGISKTTLYAHMAAAGIPRGQDLDEAALRAALAIQGSDLAAVSAALRVSPRALRLRMRALGI